MRKFFALILLLPLCIFASDKKDVINEMKLLIEKDWILLPMHGNEKYHKVEILNDEKIPIFVSSILLTDSKPNWRAPVNVSAYKGKEITIKYGDLKKEPSITQTDNPAWTKPYTNRARPLFHLTAKEGCMGESCGMFYRNGKWHCFFLNNPYAMNPRGPYFVSHAVSDDLTKWFYRKPIYIPTFDGKTFLYPTGGSAVATDDGVHILWRFSDGSVRYGISQDLESIEWKGDIPALAGKKSSPDIFYDDDKKVWVALGEVDNGTGIFTSKDLKDWIHSDRFDVKLYAPTLHKIILSSSTVSTKYLITNFDGSYIVGDFDGEKFKPISPNMLRIFYGDVYGLKFFRNAPKGRNLAVPFIAQPPSLLRDVGQSFTNVMGLPYEMRLVDAREGLRLRVGLLPEIVEYFGEAEDALGVSHMDFQSNIFTLPDATGNNFALTFTFDTTQIDTFCLGAGVLRFDYSKKYQSFIFRRIEDVKSTQPLPDPLSLGFHDVMMFVDSYLIETLFLDGSAVAIIGDSFINPEQQIKIGATGRIYLDKVSRIPILATTQAQRGDFARRYLEALKKQEEKAKESAKKTEQTESQQ
ncbi:MAG: glycoside hydrolase family 32 protein [Opitutales bacterium]|nr:glycoside hydrolase family 32 protein [Opitutales bacterium]